MKHVSRVIFMKNVTQWLHNSAYIPPLSPACKMCAQGSKLVLLITGLCDSRCFYCPLSYKKKGRDVIYADEWKLKNEKDTTTLIQEAESITATGAGITGGDPLLVWKRVERFIVLLKQTFGKHFHIHLYTSGLVHATYIPRLIAAGLDEIRFHPQPSTWKQMEKSPLRRIISTTVDTGVDTALEIPALPGMAQHMFSLIKWANEQNIRWVNLNELEFSEQNCEVFTQKKYQVKNEISSAVLGSQEAAVQVLSMRAKNKALSIGVHYCSVSFKDGVQLTNRIKRRAKNVAKSYEVITEEGTLVKGEITHKKISMLHSLLLLMKKEYKIPEKYLYFNTTKKRIETGGWIIQKIAKELQQQGFHCFLVEEYPTADHLEVERIPLPLD